MLFATDDKNRPVKELLEYPVREILVPHYTYRNIMFVSPKELNFSNRTGKVIVHQSFYSLS